MARRAPKTELLLLGRGNFHFQAWLWTAAKKLLNALGGLMARHLCARFETHRSCPGRVLRRWSDGLRNRSLLAQIFLETISEKFKISKAVVMARQRATNGPRCEFDLVETVWVAIRPGGKQQFLHFASDSVTFPRLR